MILTNIKYQITLALFLPFGCLKTQQPNLLTAQCPGVSASNFIKVMILFVFLLRYQLRVWLQFKLCSDKQWLSHSVINRLCEEVHIASCLIGLIVDNHVKAVAKIPFAQVLTL